MLPIRLRRTATGPSANAALGRIAAELLFARISGDRRPNQRVVLPTRIGARGSGEWTQW